MGGQTISKTYHRDRARENKAFVREYLWDKVCVDCGFSDTRILQFHHKRPELKLFHISQPGTRSRQRVIEEIAKTEILCPNCHALRHLHDRGEALMKHHARKRKEKESNAGR